MPYRKPANWSCLEADVQGEIADLGHAGIRLADPSPGVDEEALIEGNPTACEGVFAFSRGTSRSLEHPGNRGERWSRFQGGGPCRPTAPQHVDNHQQVARGCKKDVPPVPNGVRRGRGLIFQPCVRSGSRARAAQPGHTAGANRLLPPAQRARGNVCSC